MAPTSSDDIIHIIKKQNIIFITPDEIDRWYTICMEEPNAERTAKMPTTIAVCNFYLHRSNVTLVTHSFTLGSNIYYYLSKGSI